jgi:glycosyltransferase involved in cell wall biosynthesis
VSLISVAVPLFNSERYIRECIESVLAQTHEDLELLIVDDGSTDHSGEIAEKFVRRDDRVRLLRHEGGANRGVSLTRRLAFEQSRGEYVALLDADDRFEPTKLAMQLAAAEAHPECLVYHCGAHCIDALGELQQSPNIADNFNAFSCQQRVYRFCDDERFLLRNPILNSSVLVRAAAVQQLAYGFPQLFQYEDWTLWVLLSSGGPFFVQPDRLVGYRVHAASATQKVVDSRLLGIYSHIEFLLSVMALCTDEKMARQAERTLRIQLVEAITQYRHAAGTISGLSAAEAPVDVVRLLDPARKRRRKWYQKLLRRAA